MGFTDLGSLILESVPIRNVYEYVNMNEM